MKIKTFIVTLSVLAVLLFTVTNAESEPHDHSGHKWKFAAVYDLHESAEHGNYVLYLSKINKKYADKHFKVLYLSTTKTTSEGIETKEETAEEIWEKTNATEIESNSFTTVLQPNKLYELELDKKFSRSGFTFSIDKDGGNVFFFQHDPSEFSLELVDSEGVSYTAKATEPAAKKKSAQNNGGVAMAACVIVSFCTLVGIIFTINCNLSFLSSVTFATNLSSGFAAGALLSATFMLVLPESIRGIDGARGYSNEAGNNFAFGISIFCGFFLGSIIDWLFNIMQPAEENKDNENHPEADKTPTTTVEIELGNKAEENGNTDTNKTACACTVQPKGWGRIVWPILIGDFMHNFVDGFAIVIAFQTCSSAVGWAVAAGAIAHEVPQELADFLMLTRVGKMNAFEALLFNFLAGLSCVIGGLIALSTPLNGEAKSIVLAFAAGVYLWIAAVECFPKLLNARTRNEILAYSFAVFLGVFLISIVLSLHQHCDLSNVVIDSKAATEGAHDGHNH
eukprot:g7518.t1